VGQTRNPANRKLGSGAGWAEIQAEAGTSPRGLNKVTGGGDGKAKRAAEKKAGEGVVTECEEATLGRLKGKKKTSKTRITKKTQDNRSISETKRGI